MAPLYRLVSVQCKKQEDEGLEMSHRYCRAAVVCNGSHCSSFLLSSPGYKTHRYTSYNRTHVRLMHNLHKYQSSDQ